MTIFGGFVRLVTPDDVGMDFEHAHDLLSSRHFLLLKHPPSSLAYDLLGSREEGDQGFGQLLGFLTRLRLQNGEDFLRLSDRVLSSSQQLAISLLAFYLSGFSTPRMASPTWRAK